MSTNPPSLHDVQPDGFFTRGLAEADPAVFGGRAARSRPMRRVITSASTRSTSNGTASRASAIQFLAWMKENVLNKTPEDFARHVEGLRTAAE